MVVITSQLERKRALGLPLESQAAKPSVPIVQEQKVYIYVFQNDISKHKEKNYFMDNIRDLIWVHHVKVAEFIAC